MQGTATVLLVSLDDAPDGLKQELSRLGLKVVPCAFSDTEECLESESADLILLSGTRGAMELTMILEDQPESTRAKMVIVAERKSLAVLRGINRDIVVSLFAVETTERIIAQRIESLARRAVRRRLYGNSMAPTPSMPLRDASGILKDTEPVAKIIEAPAPDFLNQDDAETRKSPEVIASPLPSSLPVGEKLAQKAILGTMVTKKSEKQTAVGLPTGRRPEPGRNSSEQALAPPLPSTAPTAAPLKKSVPHPMAATMPLPPGGPAQDAPSPPRSPLGESRGAAPPAPSRAASALEKPPARKAPAPPSRGPNFGDDDEEEDAPDSLVVMDDELLVSLPPSEAPEDGEESAPIPQMPPSPTIAAISLPPELPEEAKLDADSVDDEVGSERLSAVELDVSSALGALDGLELREDAPLDETFGAAVVTSDEAPPPPVDNAKEDPSAVSASTEEIEEARPQSVAAEPTGATPAVSSSLSTRRSSSYPPPSKAPDPFSSEEVAELLGEPPKKEAGSKGRWWGVLGVLAMGAIGVFVGMWQAKSLKADGENDAASLAGKGTPVAEQEERGASADHAEDAAAAEPRGEGEDPTVADAAGEVAETSEAEARPSEANADGAAAREKPAEPEEAEAPKKRFILAPTSTMDNPFKAVDTKMATCDQLVGEHPVASPTDPIQAASQIWDEARKAIVGGRLNEAHIKMCQAVTLNDESAALEGLAQHYLRGRSMQQALIWLEKAEALRPGSLELANLRGDIHSLQGETDKALAVWLKALVVEPTDVARLTAISKDYSVDAGRHLRRGDLNLAELWYRRAVILNPRNLTGLVGLAKTFQRAELFDYARAFGEMSLTVSDIIPEVHVLLGELAQKDGKRDEAKARFERALEVRPGFFPAQRGLTQVNKE